MIEEGTGEGGVEGKRGSSASLPLWLSNAILNESSGHVNNSILVWNDVDTKLLLHLQCNKEIT